MTLRRPRNRDNPRLLRQQPRQRNLRRGRLLPLRTRREPVDKRLIGLAILGREARDDVPEVGAVEGGLIVDLPGEEPFAEGTEGHEPDAQFLERRQYFAFGFAPPQRVLALQRGHRLDPMRATNRLNARFGAPEVFDLAFASE